MVEIHQATPLQLPLSSSILTEAAEWAIAKGEPLWMPESLTLEKLRPNAERPKLIQFYEDLGFVFVEEKEVFGFEVALYELKL